LLMDYWIVLIYDQLPNLNSSNPFILSSLIYTYNNFGGTYFKIE